MTNEHIQLPLPNSQDISHSPELSSLIHNFLFDRPRIRLMPSQWNLSTVLDLLMHLFFQLLGHADLKHLTLKQVFLLSLASGCCRSEIHTLSINHLCLRFAAGHSQVRMDPNFLAKNQLFEYSSYPIISCSFSNYE